MTKNGQLDRFVESTAEKFRQYLYETFNIGDDTVTKIEKSKIKHIFITKFSKESKSKALLF